MRSPPPRRVTGECSSGYSDPRPTGRSGWPRHPVVVLKMRRGMVRGGAPLQQGGACKVLGSSRMTVWSVQALAKNKQALLDALQPWEERLSSQPHLAGTAVSVADLIAMADVRAAFEKVLLPARLPDALQLVPVAAKNCCDDVVRLVLNTSYGMHESYYDSRGEADSPFCYRTPWTLLSCPRSWVLASHAWTDHAGAGSQRP